MSKKFKRIQLNMKHPSFLGNSIITYGKIGTIDIGGDGYLMFKTHDGFWNGVNLKEIGEMKIDTYENEK